MKAKKGLKRLLSVALMLCMVLAMSLPVFATSNDWDGNQAVEADKLGVLQVRVGIKLKDTNEILDLQTGTGFLVNADNLVTCHHVVNFSDEAYTWIKENLDLNKKQAEERKTVRISVYRDQTIPAKIVTESAKADLSILKLDQPLQNRTFLTINRAVVQSTAPCYTLGFPGVIDQFDDINTYTSDDVTVNGGLINKRTQVDTVRYIVHNAQMPSGCSGGPLVNYSGSVVGITRGAVSGDGFDKDYMYAVDVDELIEMMDPLGIEYTTNTVNIEPTPEPDPEPTPTPDPGPNPVEVDKSALQAAITAAQGASKDGHAKDKIEAFEKALEEAQAVSSNADATQESVDSAASKLTKSQDEMIQSEEPGLPIPLPAIIAIVAAVIILIIVIVMLMGNRKTPAPNYNDYGPATASGSVPTGGGAYGGGDMYGGKPEGGTTVLGGGAGDTTVLGGGAGDTTVLGGGVSFGTLTRTKNGERIAITRDQFKIGRERNRVDYCISDNTAVGRLHAIIVNRGGSTFIVDQSSTNGTFVNSVRATPKQETPINNGDRVSFADEEFTFNAF